jgi:hypothetical protein
MIENTLVTRIAAGPERLDTLQIDPALDANEHTALIDAVPLLEPQHVVTEGDVTHVQPDIDPETAITTDVVRHDVVHALTTAVRAGSAITTTGNFCHRPL